MIQSGVTESGRDWQSHPRTRSSVALIRIPMADRATPSRTVAALYAVLEAIYALFRALFEQLFGLDHAFSEAKADTSRLEVARYAVLKQFSASILDTYIPRCRRLTQLHFGRIVSNPDAPQAFSENVGFNMTYNLVEPFKGNALHTHPSVEIFVALDGKWEIAWGETGAQTTILEPFDLVAVPEDVRHSYKNVETHTAHNIMTILPGKASIVWAPAVVSEARTHGARCTHDGVLLDFWSKDQGAANQAAEEAEHEEGPAAAKAAYHVPMSDEAMARCVRRFASRTPLAVQTPHGHLVTRWATLQLGDDFRSGSVAAGSDLLLVVLSGEAEVTKQGTFVGTATRLDAVRIPAGHPVVTLTNRVSGAPCTLLVVESQMRDLADKQTDVWRIGEELGAKPQTRAAHAYPVAA